MNYFVFADESGNLISDRFFGIGILMIPNTEELYQFVESAYCKIRALAEEQREKTIQSYLEKGDLQKLSNFSKSAKNFELKFIYINFLNNQIYRKLLKDYFQILDVRFSAIIIDRLDPNYHPDNFFTNTWDMYSGFLATLLSSNLKNIPDCQLCLLPDYLNIPNLKGITFEGTIMNKLKKRLGDEICQKSIFNITRLESHSHLLIQLVDILLGCVIYDFKIQNAIISKKPRKEPVVNVIRELMDKNNLAQNFTKNSPNYFSVWKIKF